MSQNQRRRRQAELLGIPLSTAKNRLQKSLLFELLKHLECNYCQKCGRELLDPSDLSLHHILPWEEDPVLFWDLGNVQPECVECPTLGGKVMHYVRNNLVEVNLVGGDGRSLPSYEKDGQVYFGGKKGERYELKIKNRSGSRIEVVATVDGLSVMSGEPGNWKTGRGYVVYAYDTLSIDGYRRNEDEVAAFRFTTSDDPAEDSYAGRKEMPENLGVIGIAVFKERHIPRSSQPWHRWARSIGGSERKYGSRQYGLTGSQSSGGIQSSGGTLSTSSDSQLMSKGLRSEEFDPPMERAREEPEIGTEYGEVRDSRVHHVSFNRENHSSPNEVVQIEYDTLANLERRGITTPVIHEKDAFPGMAGVKPGYAAPPPPKNVKKTFLPGGSLD